MERPLCFVLGWNEFNPGSGAFDINIRFDELWMAATNTDQVT